MLKRSLKGGVRPTLKILSALLGTVERGLLKVRNNARGV
jgi:hypothetical protein